MNCSTPQQYEPVVLIENYPISRGNKEISFSPQAHTSYSVQVIYRGLDAADGIVKIQLSNAPDEAGGAWKDHASFTHTMPAGNGNHIFNSSTPLGTKWLNVNIAKGTNNAGTVSVIIQINK